jgi:DNA-directed RNA polymerase beta subunit
MIKWSEVKPGDILIGKNSKSQILLGREKLLRAIFGDKAGDVKM